MANVNKVILIGNLTRDPEVKYTPKGSAVADISLAVNRNFTLDSGEKREETTFVDVILWGKTAELAGQYLKKGNPLYIEGRLQLDSWEDKQSGQKRSKLRVVGETMQFLGGKSSGGHSDEPSGNYERTSSAPPSRPPASTQARRSAPPPTSSQGEPDFGEHEDDIPF